MLGYEDAKYIDLESGEVIFREGEIGEDIYIIAKGSVRIYLEREDGEVHLDSLRIGDFFGEMILFEENERSASAVALEPTRLIVIKKDNFEEEIEKKPWLARKMLRSLMERLRHCNEQISNLNHELDKRS